MIKQPPSKVLDYIKEHYRYDPDTGAISNEEGPIGHQRKSDGCIVLQLGLGTTEDGFSLQYPTYGHQVAWYLTYGVWPSKLIDHINGNRSDNRLSNLREATCSQNAHNRRKVKKDTTSQYKGVTKVKGRWRAYISLAGKVRHLGYYPTEEEAATAYDRAAKDLHGAYCSLNLPLSIPT